VFKSSDDSSIDSTFFDFGDATFFGVALLDFGEALPFGVAGFPTGFGETLVGVGFFFCTGFGDSTTFEGVEDLDSLCGVVGFWGAFGDSAFFGVTALPLVFGDGFGVAFEGVDFGVAFPFF